MPWWLKNFQNIITYTWHDINRCMNCSRKETNQYGVVEHQHRIQCLSCDSLIGEECSGLVIRGLLESFLSNETGLWLMLSLCQFLRSRYLKNCCHNFGYFFHIYPCFFVLVLNVTFSCEKKIDVNFLVLFEDKNECALSKERPKLVDPNMFLPFLGLITNGNTQVRLSKLLISTLKSD